MTFVGAVLRRCTEAKAALAQDMLSRTSTRRRHVCSRSVNTDRRSPICSEPLESRRLFAVIAGFTQSQFVSGLDSPTAMEFAPDGRLFVAEQDGAVRIVTPDEHLNATPF